MTRYVFRDGDFREPGTGKPMPIPHRAGVCAPMIIRDVEAHEAPGGIYVSGRAAQRDLAKRHGLLPYERTGDLADAPPGQYDPKNDKWQSWLKSKTDKAKVKAGLDGESLKTEAKVKTAMKRITTNA